MKADLVGAVLGLVLLSACSRTAELRIATYNIQYDDIGSPVASWAARRTIVQHLLDSCRFDVFGSQEPMTYQVEDITALCPQYAWVGESTDSVADPARRHHNPVFYRPDRLTVLDRGAFWYSDTPSVRYSRGWDGAYIRMCNWVEFRDRRSGRVFFVFNSHFDHIGVEAPVRSADLLLRQVAAIAGDAPAFCLADYNSDQGTETYRRLAAGLRDSHDLARHRERDGWPSYNAYHFYDAPVEDPRRIDHIFVSGPVDVLEWEIVTYSEQGRYGSDHYPVAVTVRF